MPLTLVRTSLMRFIFGCLLYLALLAAPCAAQSVRYELGLRLRALEIDWDAATAEDKARALPELKSAVDRFFRLQLGAAARGLDRARFELTESADSERLWSAQWSVGLERRFDGVREESGASKVSFDCLYTVDEPAPTGVRAQLRLLGADGTELARAVALKSEGEWACELALAGVPEGDHRLVVEFCSEERSWIRRELSLSLAESAAQRVAAVRAALESGIAAAELERSTASRLLELLERLLAGEKLETDYPAARLLRELERLVRLEADGTLYDARLPGEFWLRVPLEGTAVDVRISAPPPNDAKLRPCVVALHGAGGSDNLFFDGYGNGAAVRLAQARGWVLIAPRAPFFGAVDIDGLLAALAERYALDLSRVYLIGHSMGAAQAIAFAGKSPDSVTALALIGGGRPGRKDETIAHLPIYIAAGTEDFGLDGARALHESLREHDGAPRLDVRDGIEHLTIVQEVLPTAFAFFDSVHARTEAR